MNDKMQPYQANNVWPVGRDENGNIVTITVVSSGPITRSGFERFLEYVEIWRKAWYPETWEPSGEQDIPE